MAHRPKPLGPPVGKLLQRTRALVDSTKPDKENGISSADIEIIKSTSGVNIGAIGEMAFRNADFNEEIIMW